jgi:hypothetical protein
MAQYVPVAIFVHARDGGLPKKAAAVVTGSQRGAPVNQGADNRP